MATITGMITTRVGEFSATSDGTTVSVYGGGGELLDTLLATVASEDELREVLADWLRAS